MRTIIIDFEKIEEKFSKKKSDFGGGDGHSYRIFEFCSTLRNFLRLESDRPSQNLPFEPYGDLWVALGQKILRNYEKVMTKS